jgi:hypothetical protein
MPPFAKAAPATHASQDLQLVAQKINPSFLHYSNSTDDLGYFCMVMMISSTHLSC